MRDVPATAVLLNSVAFNALTVLNQVQGFQQVHGSAHVDAYVLGNVFEAGTGTQYLLTEWAAVVGFSVRETGRPHLPSGSKEVTLTLQLEVWDQNGVLIGHRHIYAVPHQDPINLLIVMR